MRKDNLATIAQKAGCSVATVSRVLNGIADKNRITGETAERVMKVVRESGYVFRRSAQILRKSSSRTIGLLVPSVSNPYFAEMASIIVSEAYAKGYTVCIMDANENPERFSECIQMLDVAGVSGIIAVPCGDCEGLLEKVGSHTPTVLLDRYFSRTLLPFVTCNNYQGGLDATMELLRAGCRRIVAIKGPLSSVPSQERVRGFWKAVSDAGLSDECSVVGDAFSLHCGYVETRLLLSGQNRPDGIFALSNTILLGVVKAIREAGLSVPEDVSLISFDDNLFMGYMSPSVTRIAQPVQDMASLAFKLLLDRIAGQTQSASHVMLSPTLVAGQSIRTEK